MNNFWYDLKYFLFFPKFNFFDYMAVWLITTFAVGYSWWLLLLLVPAIYFSVAMEWRVREENSNAQANNGTVG